MGSVEIVFNFIFNIFVCRDLVKYYMYMCCQWLWCKLILYLLCFSLIDLDILVRMFCWICCVVCFFFLNFIDYVVIYNVGIQWWRPVHLALLASKFSSFHFCCSSAWLHSIITIFFFVSFMAKHLSDDPWRNCCVSALYTQNCGIKVGLCLCNGYNIFEVKGKIIIESNIHRNNIVENNTRHIF